LSSLAAASDE
jgi:hypothetical protein